MTSERKRRGIAMKNWKEMLKKIWKWILIAVVVVVVIIVALGCRDKGTMEAVSEDGTWAAYAFETKVDGKTVWTGALVYTGDKPKKIKNVRTQRCVNGVKGDFVKRSLKDSGTANISKGDVGGADQYYVFMPKRETKPNSLSVKVKWKEGKKTKVEKLWLIDQ